MDLRELKALEIAARAKVEWTGQHWSVPSQSTGGKYRVVLSPEPKCECEDYLLRQQPCKHIIAARLVCERDFGSRAPAIDTDAVPKRPTYRQKWTAYNEAQSVEKDRFQELLTDLLAGVPEPERTGGGRKPHTYRDCLFAMTFKVYATLSSRRSSSDFREAHRRGHLTKPIPGMKVNSFFENPEFTPILKSLIGASAAPLRVVDTRFAIDSSGFGSSKFERWYDQKYGTPRQRCLWVKCHIATGVKTNVVTAVRILDKDANDCPQFTPLVQETARTFTVEEVSADKAYLSVENFEAVAGCGGTGFIAFKSNSTGAAGGLFEKMFHYFQFQREDFLKHYHHRSNVESTFSMVKRKFGDNVRSRSDVAMVNEVLCKFLAHNLCVLIQEQHELGIEAVFWKNEPAPAREPDILRFPAGA